MALAMESGAVTDLANFDDRDEDEEDDEFDSLLLGGNVENKELDKEVSPPPRLTDGAWNGAWHAGCCGAPARSPPCW